MTGSPCPCGSGSGYSCCCQLHHKGVPASTPEALMRSRYCAFVLHLEEYLLRTWHSSTRPAHMILHDSPHWKSLQVLSANEQNDKGHVHFRAIYQDGNKWGFLVEESDFVREMGKWFYVKGKTREGQLKPGRNDVCPCGSNRKFKVCCA